MAEVWEREEGVGGLRVQHYTEDLTVKCDYRCWGMKPPLRIISSWALMGPSSLAVLQDGELCPSALLGALG